MVERNVFKTKLCLLYQRGRCTRLHCNYAHGDADLRSSFKGRQEYQGGRDLRERLGRMRSPLHNSPGRRDTKTRHSSHGDSPRSLGKKIDRNTGKRKQLDGHSDYSGRMSDGTEDQIKDRRPAHTGSKIHISEQELKEFQSEIKMLESDKRQLEMYLEDKVKESESLTLKIHDLEMQLSKEKEEGKRFTTKIKEFIKAHKRNLRLQDELKRSHAKLQKLGEQLDLDGNEDDSKIYTSNDDIIGGYISPLNDGQITSSPHRKRPRVIMETQDASDQVNTVGVRTEIGRSRGERLPRLPGNHDQLSNSKKPEADNDEYNRGGTYSPAEKYRASEIGPNLPSTGIAANAIDEDVEVVETDAADKTGDPFRTQRLPFLPPPPPPPIPQNAYAQYKCDDENVDIDGIDEETVDVDIV